MTSVVVLTHDRPRQLTECVRSLLVQRTTEPFDIVIADDGSGPRTAAAIDVLCRDDPRIRHVRHAHRGIAATRNLGVAAAQGEFVAIVADDYVLAPDYLATAFGYLRAHPSAGVVRFDIRPLDDTWGSRVSHFFYSAAFYGRLEGEGLPATDLAGGVCTTSLEAAGGAVFRREVLEAVGPWDEQLQRGEDSEHTRRLRALGYEVHLIADGSVRHHYRAVPVDTVRKCFLHGMWGFRLPHLLPPTTWRERLTFARRGYGRAKRARLLREVAALLPWMVLFEAAMVLGAVWSAVTRRPRLASDPPVGARALRRP